MKGYMAPEVIVRELNQEDVITKSSNVLAGYDDIGDWNDGWFDFLGGEA